MARDRHQVEQLKDMAVARAGHILAELGIREKLKARGATLMFAPYRDNKRTPAFALYPDLGCYDFGAGAGGDVFVTVALIKGWHHLPNGGFVEAKAWLEDRLGVRRMTTGELAAATAKARHDRIQRQAEDVANAAAAGRRAFEWWRGAVPIFDTPAETYLRSRGIDVREEPFRGPRGGLGRPHVLRFLARAKHTWQGVSGDPRNGEESYWPCMMAACCELATGKVRAVHRTWLTRDGSDKAPVTPARKTWPAFAGLVIPLWKGESGLSVREACANGLRETLVLTEGNEDGLTAVIGAPQYRTAAMIALDNLSGLRLPDCIDSVMVHRQTEWTNRAAVEAFERGKRALEAQGRPVVEIHAKGGVKDLNDALRGNDAAARA